jgi:hypothetical protein
LARHYNVWASPQLAMGHLMQAQRLRPPLDVSFVIYQSRRNADSAGGTNALSRVAFDKWLADGRR